MSDVRSDALSDEAGDARCDVTSIEMSNGMSDEVSFRVSLLRYFPANSEASLLTSFEASFQGSNEERDEGLRLRLIRVIEKSEDRPQDAEVRQPAFMCVNLWLMVLHPQFRVRSQLTGFWLDRGTCPFIRVQQWPAHSGPSIPGPPELAPNAAPRFRL